MATISSQTENLDSHHSRLKRASSSQVDTLSGKRRKTKPRGQPDLPVELYQDAIPDIIALELNQSQRQDDVSADAYDTRQLQLGNYENITTTSKQYLNPQASTTGISMRVEATSAIDVNARPTHIRFGSEDLPTVVVEQEDHEDELFNDDDHEGSDTTQESNDDIPESIATSAAQTNLRALTAATAKAVNLQRAKQKQKRQEADTRLKEQAKISTAKQIHKFREKAQHISKHPELPPLLPDEILLDEPAPRPPTPPPSSREKQMAKPATTISPDKMVPEKPKPVQIAGFEVRVLETVNPLLPPKPNESTKFIKECWLVGRRGKGGVKMIERRKTGGGFLRSSAMSTK